VAGLEGLEPERGIGPLADDLLRLGGGDLLDLHSARPRGHRDVGPAGAVERDGEVQLGRNHGGFLHQHREDLDAVRGRLRRLEHHAQDPARRGLGRGGILAECHPARLAAPARVHLGLHHHASAQRSAIARASRA
jgi:hypothetical protein